MAVTKPTPGDDAPNTHREIFFDAPYRVGKGIATFGSYDHAVFGPLETMDAVTSDSDAMDAIVTDRDVLVDEMFLSEVAMYWHGQNAAAMDRISVEDALVDDIMNAEIPLEYIFDSSLAVGKMIAHGVGLSPSNYASLSELLTDSAGVVSDSDRGIELLGNTKANAMADAFDNSPAGVTTILKSAKNMDFWSYPVGTEGFWRAGSLSGAGVTESNYGGSALDTSWGGGSWSQTLDLTDVSTFETEYDASYESSGTGEVRVEFDDTVEFTENSPRTAHEVNIDVSAYSGLTDVSIIADQGGNFDLLTTWHFITYS